MGEDRIRPARAADAHAIARVHVEAWRAAYRGLVPEEVLTARSVQQRQRVWSGLLTDDDERFLTLVTLAGGRLVAFCSLAAPSRDPDAGDRTAEVAAIYVAPAQWRRGVGTRLLERALRQLREAGWREATVWAFAGNSAALAFYDRFGFRLDGARKVHPGTGLEEVRARVSLGG